MRRAGKTVRNDPAAAKKRARLDLSDRDVFDTTLRRPFPVGVQFHKALLCAIALIAINFFIYEQVRGFDFIGWDDPLYITQNEQVSKGLSWEGIKWAFASGHAANWHPLTWISHMLDVQVFGVAPGPIHLTNLLFHIVNSLLLYWLLFRMTSALGRSAFVAALFAAHPLHIESVAWVAERKDVLSTFFLLLSLLAYTAYARKTCLKQYLLANGFFVMALMSKPMVVTLPLLMLLLDIWPLGRARLHKSDWGIWRRLALEKLPFLALAGIVSLVTLVVQHQGGTVAGFETFPLGSRLGNAAVSYIAYLQKMLWPGELSPFYPYQRHDVLTVACSLLGLIAISFVAVRLRFRHPFLLVGWCWYLVVLLPVIGFIQVGDQARADRYTYLPLVGIFVIVAWAVYNLLPQRKPYKLVIGPAAGLVVCILSLSARTQAAYWRDAFTLWQHSVASTVNNAHAHVNLGFALMDRGETEEAISHYSEAVRIKPNFAEAHNALGAALLSQNRINEAAFHFGQALRIKPTFVEAQANMGSILARQGKLAEAISVFSKALAKKTDDARLHLNMGLALAESGMKKEAADHYSKAIRIKPDFVDPYIQLGNLLLGQGEHAQAIAQYEAAIRIQPNSLDAHFNLGMALLEQGRTDEAIIECSKALQINTAFAPAHNCRGNAMVQAGREEEAIREYSEAMRINPSYAEAHFNLAKVLINRMRDAEAIPLLREGLRIRPDSLEGHINMAISLINTGQESEAINHLKKVLAIQPDNEAAKTIFAAALQQQRGKR